VPNIVALAFKVLPANGDFYPIPIVGPIIVGTTLGSFSAFMPLDKGLSPIANGCPWAVQGAFMTATFYHLMINDVSGPLGNGLRSLVGTYNDSETRLNK
jgi:hypothetical protein